MRNFISIVESGQDFTAEPFFQEIDDYLGGDHDSPDGHEFNWSSGDYRVSLVTKGPSVVEIRFIQIDESERRNGRGTEIMKEICRLADKHRIKLTLIADESNDSIEDDSDGESDYDETEHWLQNWYSGLGFDYTGETSDYGPWMERLPR